MRKMLTTVAFSIALAAMLVPPGSAAKTDFPVGDRSTISRTLRFDGERVLNVHAINGSIRVIGTDRADVQLDVLRTVRAETEEDLDAAEREVVLDIAEATPGIDAIVRERNGNVCGDADSWSGGWRRPRYVVTHDFAIQVPRETRLRLCTISGDEILVEGTSGTFDLSNVNGRITMPNVRGSGTARTVNGAIVARFTKQPTATSGFKTINGDIVVGFPRDFSADLRMKTFNGGLFTDFDVQPRPQPVPVAERRGGRFVYRSRQFTLVRAGHGGPELTFDTFNGSVRVVRAAE
jgi:hypothetical protein